MSTLKSPRTLKFVLPLLALTVVAVTTFAFKSKSDAAPAKAFSNTYVYEFTGDASIQSQVEDLSRWQYNASGSSCLSIDAAKACTILVDAAHAANSTLSGSNLTITADNDKNAGYFRVIEAVDDDYAATPTNQPVTP
ncbi:hypothetical protein LL912_23000 [Niabella sp. CC-SYL272]|uniref:hypothetical protein n=1 Tax=Niabella agricola TaxID=2891571 RepID=UPI001F2163BB|nr:hypothetical protein [Niabella agricola]MCF3111674.1 hypothetical protein [Niabella agricola]